MALSATQSTRLSPPPSLSLNSRYLREPARRACFSRSLFWQFSSWEIWIIFIKDKHENYSVRCTKGESSKVAACSHRRERALGDICKQVTWLKKLLYGICRILFVLIPHSGMKKVREHSTAHKTHIKRVCRIWQAQLSLARLLFVFAAFNCILSLCFWRI